jgi:hypothetical protein
MVEHFREAVGVAWWEAQTFGKDGHFHMGGFYG